MSSALQPQLIVRGPDGQSFIVKLSAGRLAIGREGGPADVGLPDPQTLISRLHCQVERAEGRWWVVDSDSRNGTFLQSSEFLHDGGVIEPVRGRTSLNDGDVIRILGRLNESGSGEFWELAFSDPTATRFAAVVKSLPACLAYDWAEGKPYLAVGKTRCPLTLRPQAHILVRHMVQQNAGNSHVPVLCSHDSLIDAVWGEDSDRTRADVAQLVSEVREEIRRVKGMIGLSEPRPASDGTDALLETERGLGYRLVTCP